MKNLEFSLEREIEFMNEYFLTADELFLIKLIFYAQEGHTEYLSRFFTYNYLGKTLLELLQSLQTKGIIIKTYKLPIKGDTFDPNSIPFNKHFLNKYLKSSQDLGMELFSKYPSSTIIDGRIFSLRNVTKIYNSFDEMCFAYGKAIKFDPQTHEHVLQLLQTAIENDWIKSGICDFIESRKWLDIEDLINKNYQTFNPNKLI